MNVKSNLNLIRGILYVSEIIRCGSINRAAEENNIKASNLSRIINSLENQIGQKLFVRSALGCKPTVQGYKIAEYAKVVQEQIIKLECWCKNKKSKENTLNIYISPEMELQDCGEFEKQHSKVALNFVNDDRQADIKISNLPPKNINASCTELKIGKEIKQKIWICCNEQKPAALEFFDFIVAKLLLLYA